MVNYDTIPEEAQVQPAAKTAWRRVVVVAAAASFVLGAFALRTATPTVALDAEVKLGPVKHEVVPVASALDYTGPDYWCADQARAFYACGNAKCPSVEFPMFQGFYIEQSMATCDDVEKYGFIEENDGLGLKLKLSNKLAVGDWCKMARAWADDTCGAGACYDELVAWSLCTQNIYDCYKCSEHIQKIEGVFTLVFDPPEINGGIDCGFLCPATDGPPVPSFVDDQDEDEPEDQSEDQDADADEPEDQSEELSEGD